MNTLLLATHTRVTATSPDIPPSGPALCPVEGQPLPLLLTHQLLPRHQDPVNTATAQALTPPSLQLSSLFRPNTRTARQSRAKPGTCRTSSTVCSRRGPAHGHPQPLLPSSILFSDMHRSLPETPCSAWQTSSAGVHAHRRPSAPSLCLVFKER